MLGYIVYDKEGIERNRWFAGALTEYAERQGLRLSVLVREELDIEMLSGKLVFVYQGKILEKPELIINRTIDPFMAECFELAGCRVFNSAEVCRICNDKRLTHAFMTKHGIDMADSVFASKKYPLTASPFFPAVIKSADGHGGQEVFWADNNAELDRAKDKINSSYLVQKPVKSLGRDLRVYVMGGRVLCSVLRSCDKDFRSNFSLGGSCELYTLTGEQKALVDKVSSLLPLTFAGIDFIFDGEQMLLNEIEDIVGSRMIYTLTDMPVHQLLIDEIISQVRG